MKRLVLVVVVSLLSFPSLATTLTDEDAVKEVSARFAHGMSGPWTREQYDLNILESGEYRFELSFALSHQLPNSEFEWSTQFWLVRQHNEAFFETADERFYDYFVSDRPTNTLRSGFVSGQILSVDYEIILDANTPNFLLIEHLYDNAYSTITYHKISSVPLPTSVWLLLCGLGSLLTIARKR
jgi:hypothetical protein